jgi:hypothetical protein
MLGRFRKKKNEKAANPELPFRAYTGSEPYVFISYAHADSDIVFPIINELNNRKIIMWYDEGIEAGSEWPQVIADKILKCSKFMLFISPNSMKSRNVRQEINFANSNHKQILPVYIKKTKVNAGIDMTISVFQSVFYYAYKNDTEDFYMKVVKALSEGFVEDGAGETVLEQADTGAVLRLDETGDPMLPPVIHLPKEGIFTIGRFDVTVGVNQSDFEFSKDTRNISRKHASFEYTDAGYTVTDLGSKAGTWINGRTIPRNIPQVLESGVQISFGNGGANYIFEL